MMAAAVHANVGLFRAPMAVYNAWCDRVPVLLLAVAAGIVEFYAPSPAFNPAI